MQTEIVFARRRSVYMNERNVVGLADSTSATSSTTGAAASTSLSSSSSAGGSTATSSGAANNVHGGGGVASSSAPVPTTSMSTASSTAARRHKSMSATTATQPTVSTPPRAVTMSANTKHAPLILRHYVARMHSSEGAPTATNSGPAAGKGKASVVVLLCVLLLC